MTLVAALFFGLVLGITIVFFLKKVINFLFEEDKND